MLIAPLVVAGVLLLRALPVKRFVFWVSWSWYAGAVGVAATFVVLAGVSFAGLYGAGRVGWPAERTPFQAAAASLAAHAAVRRTGKHGGTGASLALGLLPDTHDWVTGLFVKGRVERWANDRDDAELIAAAQRIDRLPGTKPALRSVRINMRKARTAELAGTGAARDEARDDLVDHVIAGHVRYELRRMQ